MQWILRPCLFRNSRVMLLLAAAAAMLMCVNVHAAGNADVAQALALVDESRSLAQGAQDSMDPEQAQAALDKANEAAALLAAAMDGATGEEAQALMDAYVEVQDALQSIASAAQSIALASGDADAVALAESVASQALASVENNNTQMDSLIAAGASLSSSQQEAYEDPAALPTPSAPASLSPSSVGGNGGGGSGGDSAASPI